MSTIDQMRVDIERAYEKTAALECISIEIVERVSEIYGLPAEEIQLEEIKFLRKLSTTISTDEPLDEAQKERLDELTSGRIENAWYPDARQMNTAADQYH